MLGQQAEALALLFRHRWRPILVAMLCIWVALAAIYPSPDHECPDATGFTSGE